jgi:transmembrane sensor
MKAPMHGAGATPEDLQREARVWLRCFVSGNATYATERAFLRWRSVSPLHAQAFVEAQRWWRELDPVMAKLLIADRELVASLRAPRQPAWGRRAFLGGAASAATLAAVGLVYSPLNLWATVGELRADYRTGAGEQRQIALTEHVSMEMNTQSAITRRDVGGRMAGIELVAGEAAFDLRAPTRGFSVSAGVGRSIATDAGHFEVRHLDGTSCVTCVQGTLRVDHPSGTRQLMDRQQLTYGPNVLGDVTVVDPAIVSAWRDGILVFRHAPLAQVIGEINRYRPGHVVLLAKGVAGREINGRFPIHSLDTTLLQIQRTYELTARQLPGGLLLLS